MRTIIVVMLSLRTLYTHRDICGKVNFLSFVTPLLFRSICSLIFVHCRLELNNDLLHNFDVNVPKLPFSFSKRNSSFYIGDEMG